MKPASQRAISRRRFLGGTALASAALASPGLVRSLAADAGSTPPTEPARKIKLGVIGCGSRGKWIANLFASHGGYVVHAVADYLPAVADKAGTELGVDPARSFSNLSC